MAEWLQTLTELLNASPLRELSDQLLRSVPGLPPILQTVHLLGVAILMGSVVMLSLRLLGIASRHQDSLEMSRRLFPWFFWALPVMLLSALPFFLARPQRYLTNPVFGIKALCLLVGLLLSILLWHKCKNISDNRVSVQIRLIASITILAWLMTTLAGRWIAYSDYIFWPG